MTDAVNRTLCGVDLRASTEAFKVGEPGTDRVDDVDSGVEIPEVILSPEWTRSMVARLYPSKKLRTFLCFLFLAKRHDGEVEDGAMAANDGDICRSRSIGSVNLNARMTSSPPTSTGGVHHVQVRPPSRCLPLTRQDCMHLHPQYSHVTPTGY